MGNGVAGMAGLALGLIRPGLPLRPGGQVIVAAHGQHIAVAALTGLAGGGHGAPQALGIHPRMAVVAGRGGGTRDDGRIAGRRNGAVDGQAVVLVHGPGQVLLARLGRRGTGIIQIEGLGVMAGGAEYRLVGHQGGLVDGIVQNQDILLHLDPGGAAGDPGRGDAIFGGGGAVGRLPAGGMAVGAVHFVGGRHHRIQGGQGRRRR